MNTNAVWEAYKDWLLDKINWDRRGYDKLMHTLHNIPFEWSNYRDENRAYDGTALRYEFLDRYDIRGDFDEVPMVLEVLVGLAIRIENEYIGDPSSQNPSYIFWEMCCNLELDKYTDRFFDADSIYEIVEGWLDRDFSYDGEGSIFPIKNPIQDQRKIEIWSQMQEYLSENYS